MLDVLGHACRDITCRVEILPRPGETLNARITRQFGAGFRPFVYASLRKLEKLSNSSISDLYRLIVMGSELPREQGATPEQDANRMERLRSSGRSPR
jgi:hypothetical protein